MVYDGGYGGSGRDPQRRGRTGGPGRSSAGKQRAGYVCPLSDQWRFWTSLDGQWKTQEQFAELLEDRLYDLTSGEGYPDPISVLEMARNLKIYSKGQLERRIDKVTGEHHMVNKLEHAENSTKIHASFLLALPVFEGGTIYKVEARIRFQLRSGAPVFSYSLFRRAEIQRDAFAAVRDAAREATALPVFAGCSESGD